MSQSGCEQKVATLGYVRLERSGRRRPYRRWICRCRSSACARTRAAVDDLAASPLQRGPIVYCVEQADNELPLHTGASFRAARLRRNSSARLGGLVNAADPGVLAEDDDWRTDLYRADRPPRLEPSHTVAVPYATWDNRSAGQMRVWIHEDGHDGSA